MARCTLLLAGVASISACAIDETGHAGDHYAGSPAETDTGDDPSDDGQGAMLTTGCTPYGDDVYTPFSNFGPVTSGDVTSYPWRGEFGSYPDSLEDFRGYGPTLPVPVECGSDKGRRDHLDVTSGCLTAVTADGGKAGRIGGTASGYYRSFALPYDVDRRRQVAWKDQGVEYRFKYAQWTGNVSGPGFKAFVRYMTEYDLYVASWRMDGVVQIQKKQCGQYTVLKRIASYGAPSPNVWHTIRFQVAGDQLKLYLDGRLAMTATDDSIKSGTAGIRIDSAEGALIDDWRVYAP